MSRSESAGGARAHGLSSPRQRLRLIRSAWAAGPWLFGLVWVVGLLRALLPTATGLATGWLVSRLISAPYDRGTLVTAVLVSCALILAGQVGNAVGPPLAFSTSRRVDARHRDHVAALMGTPSGLGHLEDPAVQDQLAAATMKGLPGWASYTFGTASVGQIVLVTRIAGACAAALVLARFSWAGAAALLALTLFVRTVTQREWLAQHAVVRELAPRTRRATYWADVATLPWAAKEVRVFDMGPWAVGRFRRHMRARAADVTRVHLRLMRRAGWMSALMVAGVAAVLVSLAAAAAEDRIAPGSLAVYLGALWGVVAVHGLDVESFDVEFAGLPTLAALDQLTARVGVPGPDTSPAPPASADRTAPHVRFESVEFGYASASRPVLSGLDLDIRPGELVAVVGANGAGKTTLTKLLTGLYEPTRGRVTIDGEPLTARSIEQWRRQVAFVAQDFVRYDLSLRDNVALGAPAGHADPALLAAVAAQAGLDDLVARAPSGWDTPLSPGHEGGMDLSGGQWQRVALARALFAVARGARLLVLDEPTAHLDVRAELATFARVADAASDAGVVLISHRLSTVRRADRILLLDGGRVTEEGRHDELLARGGGYAKMFAAQAHRFDAPAGTEARLS
ncbi:ABC transporter ATP-binding protein [Streptomyces avermitilis]|uniref:ABC transporter ATP-binding protein n=1 Tax=Streptomyces avermitilis TaxID=33903 RepID=UPI0033ADF42C